MPRETRLVYIQARRATNGAVNNNAAAGRLQFSADGTAKLGVARGEKCVATDRC